MKKLILALFFLMPALAAAKTFRNAYISFELPDNWNCTLEHTEWVCRSAIEKETKEAIIILTAKEVGPTDTFAQYKSHLSSPQTPAYKTAQTVGSQVQYPPKDVSIQNQQWIDGLHMGSEISNYFTRYMATVKEKIAILVTFSAHKDHYAKYSKQFFDCINSMRVIATAATTLSANDGVKGSGETIWNLNNGGIDGAGEANLEEVKGHQQGSSTKMLLIGLAVLLAAIAGYIFWKMKNDQ